MNWQVTDVEYVSGHILILTFRDGSRKSIDLKDYIKGEVFEPLKDLDYFRTVKVNPDLDTICWDNGADFAPEFLYDKGVPVKDSSLARS